MLYLYGKLCQSCVPYLLLSKFSLLSTLVHVNSIPKLICESQRRAVSLQVLYTVSLRPAFFPLLVLPSQLSCSSLPKHAERSLLKRWKYIWVHHFDQCISASGESKSILPWGQNNPKTSHTAPPRHFRDISTHSTLCSSRSWPPFVVLLLHNMLGTHLEIFLRHPDLIDAGPQLKSNVCF